MQILYSDLRERFRQLSFDDPSIVETVVRIAAYAARPEIQSSLLSAVPWTIHSGDRQAMVLIVKLQNDDAWDDPSEFLVKYCETIYRLTGITDIRFMLCRHDIVWTVKRDRFWRTTVSTPNGGMTV